jgi:copper chaperone NosL
MRMLAKYGAIALLLLTAACSDEGKTTAPPPQAITSDSVGYYCGMLLEEHGGPKGQILLQSGNSPVWFSSVRDTFTFLRLPEEPKDIAAIYVSDMAKAPDWEKPGAENWIAAADAVFVVGSDRQGGMGGAEAVPFGAKDAATAFVAEHGGKIVGFEEAKAVMAETMGHRGAGH